MAKQVKGLYRRPGSPNWWIRCADSNGRICRESTGTTQKKLAEAILDKKKTLAVENRQLDVKKVSNATFYELCTQYWNTHGKHLRMKGLSNMIESWKTGIGNPMLKALTTFQVERYLNGRIEKDGLKPATRNRHIVMLRAMFNQGIKWGAARIKSYDRYRAIKRNWCPNPVPGTGRDQCSAGGR